jgi:hypothetical protein
MTTPASRTANSPPASSAARLEQVRHELARECARTNRAIVLSVVVGLLAMVALGVYFYVGYSKIKPMTEPAMLVDYVQLQVEDQIPKARQTLEEEIKNNAPKWAQGLSNHARENMPTAREKLEQYILEELESKMNEAAQLSEVHFRTFLRKNKPTLEKNFKDLSKRETLADDSLNQLAAAMEEQLQTDMKKEAKELLATLIDINTHLQKLKDGGKSLSAPEQKQRRVVMLLRREAMERIDPLLGKEPQAEPVGRPVTPKKTMSRPTARGISTETAPANVPPISAKPKEKPASAPPKVGDKKK